MSFFQGNIFYGKFILVLAGALILGVLESLLNGTT